MRRRRRWMRTAVEPDRPLLRVGAEEMLDGDRVLRGWIAFFGDPHANRPAIDVRRDMRAALLLGLRETRRVPTVRVLTRGGVDRQAKVVGEVGARAALWLILVEDAVPVAVEEALRAGRCREQRNDDRRCENGPPKGGPHVLRHRELRVPDDGAAWLKSLYIASTNIAVVHGPVSAP